MPSSNMRSGTATQGLRRAFLVQAACGLLTALLAAPAPATAQDLIGFTVSNGATYPQYQIRDDGTDLRQLPIPQRVGARIFSTTRSDHPSGRQYMYPRYDGQAGKGKNGFGLWDLLVWSEGSGQSKALTNFPSPLSVSAYPGTLSNTLTVTTGRWSNDGLDSFVSFLLFNGVTKQSATYRANISAADIAAPSFLPITSLADPRLVLVKDWGVGAFAYSYWWGHDGSRIYYADPRDLTKVRAKTVGVGLTIDDDPIVFIAPALVSHLRVMPPVGPLDPDRYLLTNCNNGTPNIIAMDLRARNWWYLATPAGTGLSNLKSPVSSPDGSSIAFGASRLVSKGSFKCAVYRVSFFGGPIIRVTTEFTDNNTNIPLEVSNWHTP